MCRRRGRVRNRIPSAPCSVSDCAAALATLPERQRLVVTLFDAEGFSHAEIADLVGAPEGTVRSELFHARRALREELGALREEMR